MFFYLTIKAMSKYIYLTCNPEALVASMLPPEGFGLYLSTGTKKRNKGQAIFFEVDLGKIEKLIDMDSLNKRCVAKPDGSPKKFCISFRLQGAGNNTSGSSEKPVSYYGSWNAFLN